MAGRDDRNRSDDRVNVGKGLRQLANTWQTAVQHVFAEVVEFQQYVILVRATAVAGNDFLDHGTSNHVATGQVFGVRRITLHETLAMGVDQVTTFTTATFGDQYTGAGDASRVELPHFDVLHRYAGTQGHAHAITGVDQGVGGGSVDTASTASGQNHSLGTDINGFAGFDADGNNADDGAVLVLHQIHGIPLVKERGASFQVGLVQGVQQGVTGTVSSSAGTCSLSRVIRAFGLTAEWTLIDATLFGTGERQTHVLQFEYGFRTNRTHVLDSVLVTDIVGTLDGVVHVPAPIVIRISRSDSAGDATLSRHSVRTSWENFGDDGGFMTTLSQLQCSAHTRAAATNNDGVIRKSANACHGSVTPKNLHAPDEEREHGNATRGLEQKTHDSRPLTQRHWRQVVGGNCPHANPGVNTECHQGQQTEDTHCVIGEQRLPFGITQAWVAHHIAQQEKHISREDDSGNTLRHPVIKTRTREIRDVGYHIHTPSSAITIADTTITIFEPSLPPSSVSPMPMSMIKWRIPATRWYSRADNRPQITNLASGLVKHSFTSAKPSADASDLSSPYSSTAMPKNRMIPETR